MIWTTIADTERLFFLFNEEKLWKWLQQQLMSIQILTHENPTKIKVYPLCENKSPRTHMKAFRFICVVAANLQNKYSFWKTTYWSILFIFPSRASITLPLKRLQYLNQRVTCLNKLREDKYFYFHKRYLKKKKTPLTVRVKKNY